MSWARYDDELPMNHKIGRLRALGVNGIAALGLHLLANTYCRHNGTKGVIEPHVPELLAGRIGNKLAGVLVTVGMFHERDEGGWEMNSYAEFHDPNDPEPDKSAADRKRELSEKRAEAGRLGGLAKAGKPPSKRVALLQQEGWQNPSPGPDPVPSNYISDDDDSVDTPVLSVVVDQIVDLTARALARADRPNAPKQFINGIARNIRAERLNEVKACIAEELTVHEAAVKLAGSRAYVELAELETA